MPPYTGAPHTSPNGPRARRRHDRQEGSAGQLFPAPMAL